jgi:serine/threonine protein kinase
MPTQLTINQATTTFSQIYEKFGNQEKQHFGMRLDGNTLYTKGKYELHGIGKQAAESRAQKKEAAMELIRTSLTNEFGEDFAVKVMARLDKDRGLDMRGGVLARGELHAIQQAIVEEQANLTPHDARTQSDFINSVAYQATHNHNSPEDIQKGYNKEINNMGKLRAFLSGDIKPSDLRNKIEQDMVAKLTPKKQDGSPDTDGMTAKEIRQQTRDIQAQAKQFAKDAVNTLCEEIGLSQAGDHFKLTEQGIQRLDGIKPPYLAGELTVNELATLALYHNNPAGLQDHLNDHPELLMRLLSTPMLEQRLHAGVDQPGFDAKQFMQQLVAATGFQQDAHGLHCDVAKLAEVMQPAQGGPGIKPDLAYRVAVRMQSYGEHEGRIGGLGLTRALAEILKADPKELQKLPPGLGALSQTDMTKVEARLGNSTNLKQLLMTDNNLMIKLATCRPDELLGHLALIDRGGLSVDEAYDRILQQLPGSDAVMVKQGKTERLDTVTIQGTPYKVDPEAFGDEGAFGDIFRLEKQGNGPGDDNIVLKKVRIPKGTPEKQEQAWNMMANEIRLHAFASAGSDKVVKFLEPVRIGDDLYMAMECCDLGSLNSTVFDDGVGKIAKQTNMDPKVELALKLSFMQSMLDAMSEFGENVGIIHHDNKPGNYFMHTDGTIVAADLGTSSMGPTSVGFMEVDNAEQQSPEGCKHKAVKSAGPPYGEVTTKADCFAFGVQFVKFVLGHDMFSAPEFSFNSEKEIAMEALYEHRNGFFLPPKPQMPNPAVEPALSQYNTDLARYDRMANQKKLLELAGFTIGNDGSISLYPDDGNPLHELANSLLQGDPAMRSSATQALISDAMMAIYDPALQDVLKEMRGIVGQIKKEEGDDGSITYKPTTQQQQKLDDLSNQVTQLIAGSELWDDMLGH